MADEKAIESAPAQAPAQAKGKAESAAPASVEILLVAQHEHGALLRLGDAFKVLPPKAFGRYSEKAALPFRFAMLESDWAALLKPESFGGALGISGEYAKQADIAIWRHGFWTKSQPVSVAAKRAALAGLQRAGSAAFDALQSPKE